ncbi:diphthine methyl ester synthase-like [Lineus longissimus]|uniref:diphthine methyl ester synthase-like n=1 Tax=Lineus longissimus TaxID=88925 RepID=UPI002B4E2BA0
MFYLIGLGLGDAEDITVKGLSIVRKCRRVYLEAYTSILGVGKEALEKFYGREVILADRDMVEQQSDELFAGSMEEDVAFLVVGDPFGATTHTDLVLRCKEQDIPIKVIHNASIMNAVGCCGLQLYNYGETVSVVFWSDNWKPESYFDKILCNAERGLHSLCLLDIKVKEQTIENLMRGRKIYEPPRYMSVSHAAQQFMEIIENRKKSGTEKLAVDENTISIGIARVGSDDQKIVAGSLKQLVDVDLGGPLHSLVISGRMHALEIEYLKQFSLDIDMLNRISEQI